MCPNDPRVRQGVRLWPSLRGPCQMGIKDLHLLPKVRDSWSYLYAEHCLIDQEDRAIALHDADGRVPVPCASLMLLMLGPGTRITHAAVRALAESGCSVVWTGEEGVRVYAHGLGETRSARGVEQQARLWSAADSRLRVVRRMYQRCFDELLPDSLAIQQIRGMEGVRMRDAYAAASRDTGVPWAGRSYKRGKWERADPVNRALSAANSCLYGVCHAAVISAGYSAALGFIHTGKALSFVYDVADLYKTTLTIPVAFEAVALGSHDLESRVRHALRDAFAGARLLGRIVDDIQHVLILDDDATSGGKTDTQEDAPGELWDPGGGGHPGGVNWGGPKPRDSEG